MAKKLLKNSNPEYTSISFLNFDIHVINKIIHIGPMVLYISIQG